MTSDEAYALVEKLLSVLDKIDDKRTDDLIPKLEELLEWIGNLP